MPRSRPRCRACLMTTDMTLDVESENLHGVENEQKDANSPNPSRQRFLPRHPRTSEPDHRNPPHDRPNQQDHIQRQSHVETCTRSETTRSSRGMCVCLTDCPIWKASSYQLPGVGAPRIDGTVRAAARRLDPPRGNSGVRGRTSGPPAMFGSTPLRWPSRLPSSRMVQGDDLLNDEKRRPRPAPTTNRDRRHDPAAKVG